MKSQYSNICANCCIVSVILITEPVASLQNEVDLLGKIQHPNIISLLGYSLHGDMRFLVYELMPNGSLEMQLHGMYLFVVYFRQN